MRQDGSVVWRVRWHQAGPNRSKILRGNRDAVTFDAEITRRKRTGGLAHPDAGKEPPAQSARSRGGCTRSPTSAGRRWATPRPRTHNASAAGLDAAARADAGCGQQGSGSSSDAEGVGPTSIRRRCAALAVDAPPGARRLPRRPADWRARAGSKCAPRRESIFDYRYVIHDLRVNEWVMRYRELLGNRLLDWAGPDESLVQPPKGRTVASLGDGEHDVIGIEDDAMRPILPGAPAAGRAFSTGARCED